MFFYQWKIGISDWKTWGQIVFLPDFPDFDENADFPTFRVDKIIFDN